MFELPLRMQKAVREYREIETDGLLLYPIQVKEFDGYNFARLALEFMPQTLPSELMGLPLLAALYKLDLDRAKVGEETTGLFASALTGLALALRLLPEGELEERTQEFQMVTDPNDISKLKALRFALHGEEKEIKPALYNRLRGIIAEQNGVERIPETANADVVQSERDIQARQGADLDGTSQDLITALCALEGKDEEEVSQWAILKLLRHIEAHKRRLDYLICAIAESQGGKWKGGNPNPSPWFPKKKKGSVGLLSMDSYLGGAAGNAVENAGQKTS